MIHISSPAQPITYLHNCTGMHDQTYSHKVPDLEPNYPPLNTKHGPRADFALQLLNITAHLFTARLT